MGWLTGWTSRKQVYVDGANGAGVDYQVEVKVAETLGASDSEVSLNGSSSMFPSSRNDSGDIRFTLEDGTTECPMYVEKVEGTAPNRTATIWVKVPASLDEYANLWCYCGNSSASNVSDGEETFLWFDDGSVDKKSSYTGPNMDQWIWDTANKQIKFRHYPAQGSHIRSLLSIEDKTRIRAQLLTPSTSDRYWYNVGFSKYSNPVDLAISCCQINGNFGNGRDCPYFGKLVNNVFTILISYNQVAPGQISQRLEVGKDQSLYRFMWEGPGYSVTKCTNTFTITDFDELDGTYISFTGLSANASLYSYIHYLFVTKWQENEPRVLWVSPAFQNSDQPAQPALQHVLLNRISSVPATETSEAIFSRVGSGIIQGLVSVLGAPARRRVALLDRRTLRTLAVTWSDPVTGAYKFEGFDDRFDYLVVCDDYTKTYNAAVADWVKPEG